MKQNINNPKWNFESNDPAKIIDLKRIIETYQFITRHTFLKGSLGL